MDDHQQPLAVTIGEPDYIEVRDFWSELRGQRDLRLDACDWTALPDAQPPGGRDAWLTYRQQLRDLPDLTTDPENPDWPSPPGPR